MSKRAYKILAQLVEAFGSYGANKLINNGTEQQRQGALTV